MVPLKLKLYDKLTALYKQAHYAKIDLDQNN